MTQAARPAVPANLFFGGLGKVKASREANYVRPGLFWMKLNRIRTDTTRKGEQFLAIEMTTVKVIDNTYEQAPGELKKAHRVGEEATHMLLAKHDSTKPNLKRMLANIMFGGDETVVDATPEDQLFSITEDPCPLAGTVVEVKAVLITKRDGKPFTQVNYVREVPPAEAKAGLDPETITKHFPGDFLDKAAAAAA